MKKDKYKQEFTQVGDAVLHIVGNITAGSDIRVCGTVDGNIEAVANHVMIADDCTINGDMNVKRITVLGNINGNITAENVHLCSSGHIIGDIETVYMTVDDGGMFDGACKMSRSANPVEEEMNEHYQPVPWRI